MPGQARTAAALRPSPFAPRTNVLSAAGSSAARHSAPDQNPERTARRPVTGSHPRTNPSSHRRKPRQHGTSLPTKAQNGPHGDPLPVPTPERTPSHRRKPRQHGAPLATKTQNGPHGDPLPAPTPERTPSHRRKPRQHGTPHRPKARTGGDPFPVHPRTFYLVRGHWRPHVRLRPGPWRSVVFPSRERTFFPVWESGGDPPGLAEAGTACDRSAAQKTVGRPGGLPTVDGVYRVKAWNSAMRTFSACGLAVAQSVLARGSRSCSPA
jgi:hypothetical protein